KSDQFISQEEIRFAAIKQQAIILSGEINELCHLFRDHLENGQVSDNENIVAKV
ncbi:unnamed protein product, partial [Rotaria sp. Silwood1]